MTTNVFLYLKSNAAKRAAATTWDDEKNKAISKDNKLLKSIMNETNGINLLHGPNRSKEAQFLQDPVSVEVDNNIARSAFKFSQDTNSIGTFNPNGQNENTVDDDEDIKTVPGNNSGNMSKITGTATELSSLTQATKFNAAY